MAGVPVSGVAMAEARSTIGLVIILILAVVMATVRVVPEGHRGFVRRRGRLDRVVGPGPVLLLPGVEELTSLTVAPTRVARFALSARTVDGAPVRVDGAVLCRVSEPGARQVDPDRFSATVNRFTDLLTGEIAGHHLVGLLHGSDHLVSSVLEQVHPWAAERGVQVLKAEVYDVQVSPPPPEQRQASASSRFIRDRLG